MTSKKSFFSLAIYLNNLKRFKWGSFLYAIVLFFSVPFVFLVENSHRLTMRFLPTAMKYPPLLRESYIIIPVLLAMIVPCIAAALIFNNVHSIRQSVFIHSLPIKRGQNYLSDLLSGLTLMAAPVLFNGTVLLIMSFSVYGEIISSWSVVYWTFLNLTIIFVMFSVSAATAFLTGNTATHIGINVFVHVLPLLVALTIAVISEEFLFGFVSAENFVANRIIEKTPLVWLFTNAINYYPKNANIFVQAELWIYIAGAVLVYFCGYLLYRKRKIELSGDVAAFSAFRPIFKYLATTSIASVLFAILVENNISPVFMYIEIAVGAAIVYFACEMLMNKSFRVFRLYKGLISFFVVGMLALSFCAYTSVFGYETRVPESGEIESAAVHTGRNFNSAPLIADEEVICSTVEIHSELIKNPPVRAKDAIEDSRFLYVTYKYKNGKSLKRSYLVPVDVYDDALSQMYENAEYKLRVKGIAPINSENVEGLDFSMENSRFGYNISVKEGASEIMRAIEKDVSELSYNEIEGEKLLSFRVRFDMTYEENEKVRVFKEDRDMQEVDKDRIIHSFEITVNDNFKNTIEVLKKYSYYDEALNAASNVVWIYKKPVPVTKNRTEDQLLLDAASGDIKATVVEEANYKQADCAKLYSVDGRRVVEEMLKTEAKTLAPGEYYYIFLCSSNNFGETYMPYNKLAIPKAELPDYLKKYIEQ